MCTNQEKTACWSYLCTTCKHSPYKADLSGNLRVETDGVATTNVHMTNSYLVRSAMRVSDKQLDTSDKVVDWIAKSKYSLIDVNVLAQLSTKAMSVSCHIELSDESMAPNSWFHGGPSRKRS